jgi:hypothetical protein
MCRRLKIWLCSHREPLMGVSRGCFHLEMSAPEGAWAVFFLESASLYDSVRVGFASL